MGEFYGVANQIEQDLTQPERVGNHEFGHCLREILPDGQTLCARRHLEQLHGLRDQLAWVERDRRDIQLAGLNTRQVQNVVKKHH